MNADAKFKFVQILINISFYDMKYEVGQDYEWHHCWSTIYYCRICEFQCDN